MMLARALGMYEVEKRSAIAQLLRPGQTFVDVGANKGDFALLAAERMGDRGRVLAFEPEPANCGWIRRSVELNGYRSVQVHQLALGEAEGSISLHLSEVSGHHSIVPGRDDSLGRSIEVPVTTLDSVVRATGNPRVDLIKIDVEGADLAVLRGARRTLVENADVVVLLDVHPHLGVDAIEVCRFLSDLGFTLFEMRRPFDARLVPTPQTLELLARRTGIAEHSRGAATSSGQLRVQVTPTPSGTAS
jgi:FkbM family methyltransferase